MIDNNSKLMNLPQIKVNNMGLQLSPITVNEEYCKKWNERLTDFVCLTKNGELISNSLYRVGGLNTPHLGKDDYFMLLKYVEDFYSDDITKVKKDKPHLDGRWCIIDKNGIEKKVFESFKSPYLTKDSCIYSINSDYYNIETGECYGYSSTSMVSEEFLFLDNRYNKDKTKRGVMKINKKDGSWELFPE